MREALPDVDIFSLVPEGSSHFPFILVRRHFTGQYWRGDVRGFVNQFYLKVDAFTMDPDGDEEGAILIEAARVALHDAIGKEVPGAGHLIYVQHLYTRQAENWATGNGAVEYADLPTGVWRYEAIFRLQTRHRP
jgi:hypothetical protein